MITIIAYFLGIFVTVWILSLALTFVWSENTGKEITRRAIIISTIIAAVIRFLIFSLSSIDLIEVISIIIAIPCVLLVRFFKQNDTKIKGEKIKNNLTKVERYLDKHFDEIISEFYLAGEIEQGVTKEEIQKALQKNDSLRAILKAIRQEPEKYLNPYFKKFSTKELAKLVALLLLVAFEITKTSALSALFEYKYDDKGNKVERIEKDENGEIISFIEYKYDDKGNLIEEIYKDVSGKIVFLVEYKYDDKGNKIEMIVKDIKNRDGSVCKYKYDDKGNKIENEEIHFIYIKDTYKKEDFGVCINKYKYDDRGNEIEQRLAILPIQ